VVHCVEEQLQVSDRVGAWQSTERQTRGRAETLGKAIGEDERNS